MKRKCGITLISLVVTIVVLIIIAGISIAALTGDNSLIANARKAKEQAEIDEEKEIVKTSTVQAVDKNKYGNITKNELQEKLNNNAGDNETEVIEDGDTLVVKFVNSRRFYEVDNDGNIKIFELIEDKNPGDITKDRYGKTVDGSEDSPYEIWCIEDLVAFSQNVKNGNRYEGLYINLMRNLDFESVFSYNDHTTKDYDIYLGGDGSSELKEQLSSRENGFPGIGSAINGSYYTFNGIFDGRKNEILNFYGNYALFGSVSNATIKNLKIHGTIQEGTNSGMIDYAKNSYIINCSNYANISALSVGGICRESSSSYFYNCYNVGTILGKWKTGVGGIVGEANDGTIIYNSYNLGDVSLVDGNSYAAAGGIVGYIRTGSITIENCYNSGNIASSRYKGGIIGAIEEDDITIKNCYFLDNISNGIGNSSGGISVTLEQLKSNELINEKYITDIFNDFVKEYNSEENIYKLRYWKTDDKTKYLIFE